MAFKVGQKVKIRMDIHEDMSSPSVVSDMMDMRGDTFRVMKIIKPEGWYNLANGYVWSDEMLEPVIITQDEAFEALVNGSLTDSEYEHLIKVIQKNA